MSLTIRPYADADLDAVAALWTACDLTRPWNDPAADIARCLAAPSGALFVGEVDGKLQTSVMCGDDGHRSWIYYMAVHPSLQGTGYGRAMLAHAEEWLRAQGSVKVMLMIRSENEKVRQFYDRTGYEVEERVIMAKWLNRGDG